MKIRFSILIAFVIAILIAFVSISRRGLTTVATTRINSDSGSTTLTLRPIPVRIYEHPDGDDWILLSPTGYFEYVERDYKSPRNAGGKTPLTVRVSGSYREVPVTGKNSAGEATVKTYHLVFNIDQKSLIRLSGISGAPRVIAKLTNKLQQRLTERVEDGIEAEIRHETSEKLITGMRIITSPILAASTLINKRWSQESFARIGPVKFIKLVNEGRPDSNGDNYPNQPIAVVD